MFLAVMLAYLNAPIAEYNKPNPRYQLPVWLQMEANRFEAEYGVELVIDGRDIIREFPQFTIQANGISFEALLRELPRFLGEMRIYPSSFISKARIKRVYFCRNLNIAGYSDSYLGGTIAPSAEELFLDCDSFYLKKAASDTYRISTIHHELFHCLDHRMWTSSTTDEGWTKLNPVGFRYVRNRYMAIPMVNTAVPGFISPYARTAASEDKAETFSYMMANLHEMEQRALSDPVLQKKMNLLKTRLQTFAPELNEYFWNAVRHIPRPRLTEPGHEDAWAMSHPYLPTLQSHFMPQQERFPMLPSPRMRGRRGR